PLAIDIDGRIWFIRDAKMQLVGSAAAASAPSQMEMSFVPKSQLVIQRRQITCAGRDWKLVLLLTVRKSLRDDHPSFTNDVIVLRFQDNKGEVVLHKSYPEVVNIATDD